MLEVLSAGELVDASGGDMYARVAVLNGTVGDRVWARDGAVVWTRNHDGRSAFVGVGPGVAVGELVGVVADEVPGAARASLPRGWTDALPPSLVASDLSHWDWMWTTSPPPEAPGEAAVRWLDPDADQSTESVRQLLLEVSPGASAWPGDGRSRRWAGITDADGRLVACLADTSRSPSVGNFASVAVAHRARRHGYGRAIVSWATRQFLAAGAETVTLGMYADNDAARAMYLALGFHCEHAFTGAALTSARGDVPVRQGSSCLT